MRRFPAFLLVLYKRILSSMALAQFRKATKLWPVRIFMILMGLSFGLWGVSGVLQGGANRAVAVVGGTEIGVNDFTRQYQNRVRQLTEQTGQRITPELAAQIGLIDQMINQMAVQTAVRKHADKNDLAASDAAVTEILKGMEAFRGVGQTFDPQTYKRVLLQNGLVAANFESDLRGDVIIQQMQGVIESGLQAPKGMAELIFQFQAEKRRANYILLSPDLAGAIDAPGDEILKEFHETNAVLFTQEEYRSFSYLSFSPADFISSVTVTDDDIAALYERRSDKYITPESRMIKRLFGTQEEIEVARQRAIVGESFEDIGESFGMSAREINLGAVKLEDITDPKVAEAVFAMEAPGLSEPIEGALSWSLVLLQDIEAEVIQPIEDVRETLKQEIAERTALDVMFDSLEVVEEEIASGSRVEDIGSKVGLDAITIGKINRAGTLLDGTSATGLPTDAKFLEEVFTTIAGFEGDLIELGENQFVIIRVDEIQDAFLLPLDNVRDKVVQEWRKIERGNRLDALAQSLIARGNAGESFQTLGDELGRGVLLSPVPLSRGQTGDLFSAEINRKLFNAPAAGFVYGPVGLGESLMIAQVAEIILPDTEIGSDVVASFQQQIKESMQDDIANLYVAGLISEYGVEKNQSAIDLATGAAQITQ
jgi:peptidyl-prolyl cis-trans isomerase D